MCPNTTSLIIGHISRKVAVWPKNLRLCLIPRDWQAQHWLIVHFTITANNILDRDFYLTYGWVVFVASGMTIDS